MNYDSWREINPDEWDRFKETNSGSGSDSGSSVQFPCTSNKFLKCVCTPAILEVQILDYLNRDKNKEWNVLFELGKYKYFSERTIKTIIKQKCQELGSAIKVKSRFGYIILEKGDTKLEVEISPYNDDNNSSINPYFIPHWDELVDNIINQFLKNISQRKDY